MNKIKTYPNQIRESKSTGNNQNSAVTAVPLAHLGPLTMGLSSATASSSIRQVYPGGPLKLISSSTSSGSDLLSNMQDSAESLIDLKGVVDKKMAAVN